MTDTGIVSYVLGHPNNNPLVFDTLDKAIATNPTAKPIFHSDRGYQYTNRTFKSKLDTYEELEQAIDEYIDFYNTQRLQKKLKSMTPIEYRSHTLTA
ncbi:IS3 family transposase [Clostridium gasigenes]|nr:IS3 family transposase [Clostridium gasigenes]MBU3105822.1 IS3 family transposase [Clostridium gasigenes]